MCSKWPLIALNKNGLLQLHRKNNITTHLTSTSKWSKRNAVWKHRTFKYIGLSPLSKCRMISAETLHDLPYDFHDFQGDLLKVVWNFTLV